FGSGIDRDERLDAFGPAGEFEADVERRTVRVRRRDRDHGVDPGLVEQAVEGIQVELVVADGHVVVSVVGETADEFAGTAREDVPRAQMLVEVDNHARSGVRPRIRRVFYDHNRRKYYARAVLARP